MPEFLFIVKIFHSYNIFLIHAALARVVYRLLNKLKRLPIGGGGDDLNDLNVLNGLNHLNYFSSSSAILALQRKTPVANSKIQNR